jgi:arylsulfatase A-like enzyme
MSSTPSSAPISSGSSSRAATAGDERRTHAFSLATPLVPSWQAWPCASIIALWLCCAIELVAPPRAFAPAFPAYLLALSTLLAVVHGTLWGGLFRVLRVLPRRIAFGLWLYFGLSCMGWLAYQLGAFSRLHSRYALLAGAVLGVCGVAGLGFGALCAALQPTAAQPEGFAFGRSLRARRIMSVLLLLVFAGLQVADRLVYPNQYVLAHQALRLAMLWSAMFASALLFARLPRLGATGWLVALAGYALCLVLLDEQHLGTLNAFDTRPWARSVLTLSRQFVDFDRDGHAAYLGDTDCEPWNSHVYPGAREIPDNGIDDNCILGDARTETKINEVVPMATEPAPIDVILLTADAWNPAHTGLYNPTEYGPTGKNTTPNLERWAKNATVFDRAYTPGGWTSVAVPSMLRGVYPRRLRWRKYYETSMNAVVDTPALAHLRAGESAMHMFPLAFGDPHPTIAEMAKRRGLATMAITDDGYSGMLERGTGIERGFDSYREIDWLPLEKRDDAGTADLAIETLRGISEKKRFFLWVHFFGTHYPDTHHDGIRDYGTTTSDYYDHEVAFLDQQLVRVLDAIAQRKHPVAVFVTADHSEGLSRYTRYHGDSLDEPIIRIPLLAKVPGWPAGRVDQAVSSIDLVPTILALLKTPLPKYLDGIDLATVLGKPPERRVLFSDTWRYDPGSHVVGDFSAAYDGARKFVLDRHAGLLYAASQSDPRLTERLVGMAPVDSLSGSVFAYSAELGTLQLSE